MIHWLVPIFINRINQSEPGFHSRIARIPASAFSMLQPKNTLNPNPFTQEEAELISKKLETRIPPEGIAYRSSSGMGGQVAYLEGWRAFNYANDIFGFNGWSSEILNMSTDFIDVENGKMSVGVTCTVRVILKDGTFHDVQRTSFYIFMLL